MDKNKEQLDHLRHSTAHLLAAAVLALYPNTKNTIGPAIENGFYYDFDFENPITEEDLPKIEEKMKELLSGWNAFDRIEVSSDQAKKDFAQNPYKLELIEEFSKEGQTLTEYKSGEFVDLCRGGHAENPSQDLKAFKLQSLAGAYWRGNEKNKMLTRIYGTAFPTQQELDDYLNAVEEAKKRDHRKLGKELDLFVFSDLVGAGLPLFTPRGTILREQLLGFSEELQQKAGFQKVFIPHITKTELYKRSGHWAKFGDELFLVKSQETDDDFVLKPMNCPHHIQIYASRLRSYRDLPIRYMETTVQYRDEKAGEMLGLSRVRAITIDDAHIFCRMDQIEGEFERIMDMIKKMYGALGMEFKARLSFRDDSDKYLGDKEKWELAQKIIEDVAKKLELNYFVAEGEAAFYGPKIDIMVVDALGREWQCATQQLDFVMPERFELKYTAEDGSQVTPVMLHKALLGSIERFLSVYIEHTAGAFPTWLAPVQAMIVPIGEANIEYSQKLLESLKEAGIRAEIDDRSERMQAKIRDAQLQKIPYMLIIGNREQEQGKAALRTRSGFDAGPIEISDFINKVTEEIKQKSTTLSYSTEDIAS
jgi:threonyl-tRNA synthetase